MTTPTTRREFLKLGSSALVLLGGASSSALSASPKKNDSVLVVVFQRGAADALHLVVPYRDRRYRELRGAIAIEEPGRGEHPSLDLGDGFALHPALSPLYPFYESGELAVVMNAGSPDGTRSHFDAQDYMESGTPGRKSTRDGWLARALQTLDPPERTPFAAVSLTAQMPRTLAGAREAIALEDFSKLDVSDRMAALRVRIERAYAEAASPELQRAGEEAFLAARMFRERDPLRGRSRPRRARPLRELAPLLKANLGIRVAFVESGGWDTHFGQGGATGQMANLMRGLAGELASFLEEMRERVTLLVVTEFGRTVAINGAGGTDHGHGGAILAAGAGVEGGRVHGDWLGLQKNQLFEGRDLPVTTDFRDVFFEAARTALAFDETADLFPGYRPGAVGVVGSSSSREASSAKRSR